MIAVEYPVIGFFSCFALESRMILDLDKCVRLHQLPLHVPAKVAEIHPESRGDAIARRLGELGFVPGEVVEVRARGLFGREPYLVQIGFTRFALRRSEAARIEVVQA